MSAERDVEAEGPVEVQETRMPPPVPGGTMYLESLGRWVDNLMGDERTHRTAERELAPRYLQQEQVPQDPPPSEPPPPVPDGTGTSTRGGRPGGRRRPRGQGGAGGHENA